MKINEIIQEGIWDTIKTGAAGVAGAVKGGIAGAKSAVQAQKTAQQQQQGAKDVEQYANEVIRAWNEYTGGTGDRDVKFWASRFFDANLSDFPLTTTDLNDPAKVRNFLNNVVKVYKSGLLKPVTVRKGRPVYTPTSTPLAPKTKTQQRATNVAPLQPAIQAQSTTVKDQPVFMGGQKLDPRNPKEKAIIDQLKSQGQL